MNGAYARPCVPVNLEELEWDDIPSLDGSRTIRIYRGGRVWADDQGCFQVMRGVSALDDDIWDLPMTGGERIDVEYKYQQLTNGPEVTTVTLDGVFVASTSGDLHEIQSHFADNKEFRKEDLKNPLLHPENFHPAGALPDDGVFVVRVGALTNFIQSVNGEPINAEKPLTSRERDTLLTIIAALAKEAGINIDSPGKPAGFIEGLTAELGARVSKRAIEDHLKKIPDALGTRMK